VPDGARLRVPLLVPVGFSDWVVALADHRARAAQDRHRRGPSSTIDMNAWTEKVQRGEFVLSMGWTLPSYSPYGFYRGLLSRKTAKPIGEDAAENWHRLRPGGGRRRVRAARGDDRRGRAARSSTATLEAMFAENAPAIPLFPGPLWGSFTTKRFTGFPDAHDPYAPLSPNLFPQTLLVLARLAPR
jgi:peptide/nickel transport system substrate-binding protein